MAFSSFDDSNGSSERDEPDRDRRQIRTPIIWHAEARHNGRTDSAFDESQRRRITGDLVGPLKTKLGLAQDFVEKCPIAAVRRAPNANERMTVKVIPIEASFVCQRMLAVTDEDIWVIQQVSKD